MVHFLFYIAVTVTGFPHFVLRRSDILGPLFHRPRTRVSKGIGPLLPHMAEPRDAYEHYDLHPHWTGHILQKVPVQKSWNINLGCFQHQLFGLDSHHPCENWLLGIPSTGSIADSWQNSFLCGMSIHVHRILFTGWKAERDSVEETT